MTLMKSVILGVDTGITEVDMIAGLIAIDGINREKITMDTTEVLLMFTVIALLIGEIVQPVKIALTIGETISSLMSAIPIETIGNIIDRLTTAGGIPDVMKITEVHRETMVKKHAIPLTRRRTEIVNTPGLDGFEKITVNSI